MKCVGYGAPYEKTGKIKKQNNLWFWFLSARYIFIMDLIFFLVRYIQPYGKYFRGTILEAL
jgi:hypothetical protein